MKKTTAIKIVVFTMHPNIGVGGGFLDNVCIIGPGCYCPAGTYGQSIPSGCSSCASATGNANATSSADSKAITSCYISSSVNMADAKGTYHFSSNCYWQ
jgi:hypothetical protein